MTPVQHQDIEPAAVLLVQLLADTTRRRIFLTLLRGETCNCELAVELKLPHNLISHHIKRLRQAGLVKEIRDRHAEHWVHYVVDGEALGQAVQALTAGLTPAPVDARSPCCERVAGTSDGVPCPTCATSPGSAAPERHATRRSGSPAGPLRPVR